MGSKRHIFLLGPPAVGKLSVARWLAGRTKYPVFDNAITVDMDKLLHKFESDSYRVFRDELRLRFYNGALNSGVEGLISTYCYRHPNNTAYLSEVEELFRSGGWKTHFVFLFASRDELNKRVQSPGRRLKATISESSGLNRWLETSPDYTHIRLERHDVIDTTDLSIEETFLKVINILEDSCD